MEDVYDDETRERIRREFQRLKGRCYLDHAGATLYSETQLRSVCEDLCGRVYGNPHSLSLSSKACTDAVEEVRNRVLRHFHTNESEYDLIFTSGATAAIRLVLDNFDWACDNESEDQVFYDSSATPWTAAASSSSSSSTSAYVYTLSNHTSVVGGRELAAERGVPFFCLDPDRSFCVLDRDDGDAAPGHRSGNSLFAYPAQCNFSGRKFPLKWINNVRNGCLASYADDSNWFVLLDAATYCSTNDLDLSVATPDFVCLSFYKIFGYPTGLGALLVKRSSAHALRKSYFGGGTVEISISGTDFHKPRKNLHERFEDGTVAFLSVVALDHGLRTLKRLNLDMRLISEHVFRLARFAFLELKALRHWNGRELVEVYADTDYADVAAQGGIVNFNLVRADGRYIGYTEVLNVANLHGVEFRTGCFCNSGACQRHLRLTDDDLKTHFEAGHVCGDAKDLIDGRPTGSVRISFGYMTTFDDVNALLQVLRRCFLEEVPGRMERPRGETAPGPHAVVVKKIWTYPVKSCAGMEVTAWPITRKGLAYDREWMIVSAAGVCLTQKQEPRMCLVVPSLDLDRGELTLSFRTGGDSVTVPINGSDDSASGYELCESKVCGDRITGRDCGDDVAEWLSRYLGIEGLRLVRQSPEDGRRSKRRETADEKLSLSNRSQYLLVNDGSVEWLRKRIQDDCRGECDLDMDTFAHRFRCNFLVDGAPEFAETKWSSLTIGSAEFQVDGPCGRCQMICIDQHTGEKSRRPLVALSRALNGRIHFGVYLSGCERGRDVVVSVGDAVAVATTGRDVTSESGS